MKVRFKTQLKAGESIMPAGQAAEVPDEKAKAYIERGIAVPVEDEKTKEKPDEKAKGKPTE